jgi:hypothetical protein
MEQSHCGSKTHCQERSKSICNNDITGQLHEEESDKANYGEGTEEGIDNKEGIEEVAYCLVGD